MECATLNILTRCLIKVTIRHRTSKINHHHSNSRPTHNSSSSRRQTILYRCTSIQLAVSSQRYEDSSFVPRMTSPWSWSTPLFLDFASYSERQQNWLYLYCIQRQRAQQINWQHYSPLQAAPQLHTISVRRSWYLWVLYDWQRRFARQKLPNFTTHIFLTQTSKLPDY